MVLANEGEFLMLRKYTEVDFEDAVTLFVDAFSNPPWNYKWLSRSMAGEYINELYNYPKAQCFVFSKDNQPCGVCFGVVLNCSPVPIYEIKEIFFGNKYQGKGYGSKMLELIEKELFSQGVRAIKLSTLRKAPAYNFYLKHGFGEADDTVNMFKVLR